MSQDLGRYEVDPSDRGINRDILTPQDDRHLTVIFHHQQTFGIPWTL